MTRVDRIAAVTMGLVGAGFFFGAIAGGTSFALVGILSSEEMSIEAFEIGAMFGAPLGAITAPMLSWLLLRHVSLGKMFLVCSVGTAIGGIVGWFATAAGGDMMVNPLVGAFVGCVIAAIALRYRVQHA
jgi:ABC-type enterochelin transport system permease subunit